MQDSKRSIELPVELSNLSIEEIGCIFLVMVMPNLNDEEKTRWANDKPFIHTINDMIEEGILTIKNDEVDIDLTWL